MSEMFCAGIVCPSCVVSVSFDLVSSDGMYTNTGLKFFHFMNCSCSAVVFPLHMGPRKSVTDILAMPNDEYGLCQYMLNCVTVHKICMPVFWTIERRKQVWAALGDDDVDAFKTSLETALTEPRLYRTGDKFLCTTEAPLSLAYVCAAKKKGAPKCLGLLLETFGRNAFRNTQEQHNAQALVLLKGRRDVKNIMLKHKMWSIPKFLMLHRPAPDAFDPDNEKECSLTLACELGVPESFSTEYSMRDVTSDNLFPPAIPHACLCLGSKSKVVLDFFNEKDRRVFSITLHNHIMYILKKEWRGNVVIRDTSESPTLCLFKETSI